MGEHAAARDRNLAAAKDGRCSPRASRVRLAASLTQITAQRPGPRARGSRLSIPAGKVLADSEAEPDKMENHATRPEFAAALHGQTGKRHPAQQDHRSRVALCSRADPRRCGEDGVSAELDSASQPEYSPRSHRRFRGSPDLLALLLAFVATQSIGRRLLRITDFAERIAAGDLTARIQEGAGDEIAHVASALDKTARKLEEGFSALENSRQTLETLLNSMQEAVVAVAEDERVLWANQRMERLLPSGVRLGAPLVQSVRDPEILASVQAALTTRDVVVARAAKIFSGRVFDVTAAPMPGGGAVAVLHDQTDIERVEKTRRDFIANVSHELRTPLTSIQGYAETLLDSRNMPDNMREFVEIIRKNATRMARLTEDLAGAGAGGIGRAEAQSSARQARRSCWTMPADFPRAGREPRHRAFGDEHRILRGSGRSRCNSPGVF